MMHLQAITDYSGLGTLKLFLFTNRMFIKIVSYFHPNNTKRIEKYSLKKNNFKLKLCSVTNES